MFAYLFIAFIAIIISLSYRSNKYSLEYSFLIITLFLGIRYNFGNDYATYLMHFQIDNSVPLSTALDYSRFEPGWVYVCRLFKPIGFWGMVFILTFLENFIIYRMVKKYVTPELHWLAIFSFMFTNSLCLTGASMMRQYLAMCICLCAFELSLSKYKFKIPLSMGIIYIASLMHSSALACVPIPFLGLLKDIRISKGNSIFVFLGIFLLGIVLSKYFGSYFALYSQSMDLDKYEKYIGREDNLVFGISDVVTYLIAYFILFYQRLIGDVKVRIYVIIFILFVIANLMKPVAPLVGRIGLYFMLLFPICFPNAVKVAKRDGYPLPLLSVFIVIRLYNYYTFVTSSGWGHSFYEYSTIFNVLGWL